MGWGRAGPAPFLHSEDSMKFPGAAMIAAGLVAGAAMAGDADGKFAIKGAGLQECGQFLTAWQDQSSDLALYGGWIDGYVTGLNQLGQGRFDLAPWQSTQTLMGMAKSVCEQMPKETRFMDAFHQIVRLIAPQGLATESRVIGLNHQGRTAVIYADTLVAAKARLADAGFDPGPADDSFTEQTAAAFKGWQAAQGHTPTGLPDQQTLFGLFLKRHQQP